MPDNLAQRIQALEDMEEIRKLKARYCYLVDAAIAGDADKYDELLSYFTGDATVDFKGVGEFVGTQAISGFFKEIVAPLWSYASHMVMNPLIEIDGAKATGTWFVQVSCTSRKTACAVWVQGTYREEYEKHQGRWQWKRMSFFPDFYTPYDEGWAKNRMMDLL